MTDDKTKPPAEASSIWGGRFAAGSDVVMEAINASIDFDNRIRGVHIQSELSSRYDIKFLAGLKNDYRFYSPSSDLRQPDGEANYKIISGDA